MLVALALLALGLVMVYSASIALPDSRKFAAYTPTYFLRRHALALAIGCSSSRWPRCRCRWRSGRSTRRWIFVLSLVLLVLVLLPFVGKVVNYSRRWIPLGFMNFQPSELAKLAIAHVRRQLHGAADGRARENFFRAVWPMVVAVAFVGALLLRQPDMGAFIVIAMIAMGILFLGGVNGAHVLPDRAR